MGTDATPYQMMAKGDNLFNGRGGAQKLGKIYPWYFVTPPIKPAHI